MRVIGIEFTSPGIVQFWETGPPPNPEPTEIVIETLFSGVSNGNERRALKGEAEFRGRFPLRIGYQSVGRIAAAGPDVVAFREGDIVFLGQNQGHRGWHLVRESPFSYAGTTAHLVAKLPETLDLEEAALLGDAALGMRAVRKSGVVPGARVWVVGAGLLGQFTAQCARATGATVTVTEYNDVRLATAAACGAHRILDAVDEADIDALEDGGPYDFVFDASGDPNLITRIHKERLLAKSGAIYLLAPHGDIRLPSDLLQQKEARVSGIEHFHQRDLEIVIELLRLDTLKVAPLISKRCAVDEALDVYETLRSKPEALQGVVLDWRGGTSESPAITSAAFG